MTCRTRRYRGHYGFKTELEFLAYCRQQAAAGLSVTAAELKMLLDIIGERTPAIWNSAIDAVVTKLQKDFVAPDIVIQLVNEVRKQP